MNWINLFGLVIVILLLLPNILYALKNRAAENKCRNKVMNLIEQLGRYGSMFLMVFHIGIDEFGFRSNEAFAIWLMGSASLLLIYWLLWLVYFRASGFFCAMMLAIIPSILFIFNGFILRHWQLVISGCIFSIGHIYVTYQNNRRE